MNNVIYIDFIKKEIVKKEPKMKVPKKTKEPKIKKSKVLTKGDIHKLNQRVDDIECALDLCVVGWDDDIIESLTKELESIIGVLEKPTNMDGLTFIG